MFAVMEAVNERQKYTTILFVVITHVVLLGVIFHLQTEAYVVAPSPKNITKIRFVSMNKIHNVQQSKLHTTSTQPQIQLKRAHQSPLAVAVPKKQHIKVISSNVSKKLIIDRTKQQDVKNEIKNETSQWVQSMPEPSSNLQQISTSVKASITAEHITSAQPFVADQSFVGQQGKDSNKALSAASIAMRQEPIPVSQVDLLSFGKIHYDDRELQNQQRLLVLTIKINAKGQPVDVKMKQSSGIANLDGMAMVAAQKAKFKPYEINGEALAVVVDFPIQLKLSHTR